MTAPAAPRFTTLTSRVVALPDSDVDTDQIIPARFLKVTDKAGLAPALFADWRASKPDFPIDRPDAAGAEILLCGDNFGCGSSREHAPWALVAGGFRALVSTRFADIFRQNALKNGLLPVVVEPALHQRLFALRAANAALTLTIDLESQTLTLPGGETARFPVDPFAKRCLVAGVDELGYLLQQLPQVEKYEARRGW
jgi:3-isopropylmalate/(R)-2-methylmalate dehydratase small subunit